MSNLPGRLGFVRRIPSVLEVARWKYRRLGAIWESPALQRLGQFVRQRQETWQSGTPSFEQYEHELHEQMMALERELLAVSTLASTDPLRLGKVIR